LLGSLEARIGGARPLACGARRAAARRLVLLQRIVDRVEPECRHAADVGDARLAHLQDIPAANDAVMGAGRSLRGTRAARQVRVVDCDLDPAWCLALHRPRAPRAEASRLRSGAGSGSRLAAPAPRLAGKSPLSTGALRARLYRSRFRLDQPYRCAPLLPRTSAAVLLRAARCLRTRRIDLGQLGRAKQPRRAARTRGATLHPLARIRAVGPAARARGRLTCATRDTLGIPAVHLVRRLPAGTARSESYIAQVGRAPGNTDLAPGCAVCSKLGQ